MQRRRHCQIGNDGSKAPATGPPRSTAPRSSQRLFSLALTDGRLTTTSVDFRASFRPAAFVVLPSPYVIAAPKPTPVHALRPSGDTKDRIRRRPPLASAISSLSLMISGTPLPLVVLLFRAYSVRAIEAPGRRRPFRSPASETRRPFPHDRGSTAATSLSPMTGAGGQAGFVISLLMAVGTAPAWFPFFPRRG